MPRSSAAVIENNFKKGLLTEASGLNFPENACTETYNCIFNNDGTVQRRLGIDYEDDYQAVSLNRISSQVGTFLWEGVGGYGPLSFVVTQVGNVLRFYEVVQAAPLSGNRKSFTVNLNHFSAGGTNLIPFELCAFASGKGYLFVTNRYTDPFYIEYERSTDSITATRLNLKIRDMSGVEDGSPVDFRPLINPPPVTYNAYNQGWYNVVACKTGKVNDQNSPEYGEETTVLQNVYSFFAQNMAARRPAHSEVWWRYKTPQENFDPTLANKFGLSSTAAPKGHYILNAFFMDRPKASGIATIFITHSGINRPGCVEFFAGRAFFAGTRFQDYNQKIFFTQIIRTKAELDKCYQANDPTHEHESDLLPTDGGVIEIPEIGNVHKLVSTGTTLLVFADNGIWVISGSEGIGFTANDYTIRRISTLQTHNASSFVNVNGSPIWWTREGIYTVAQDPNSGALGIRSLTDETIRTFYNDIPLGSRDHAQGAYNPLTKTVQWGYRSTTTSDLDIMYDYDSILNFNVLTGSFYPWNFTTNSAYPKINSIVVVQGVSFNTQELNVTDGGNIFIVDANGNEIIINQGQFAEDGLLSAAFKYLVTDHISGSLYYMTFAETEDASYKDWDINFGNGVVGGGDSFESYFLTAYKVHGQGQKRFQGNYIFVYMTSSTGSSCRMQGIWDYANSGNSGRYTSFQEVYPARTNYGKQISKRRIRGQGYALQLKFISSVGAPFKIDGWSTFETGESLP